MEIERKYLIPNLPNLSDANDIIIIEQGYISISPVIRIRRANERYILTCKGKGLMAREEFELFLEKEEYLKLREKTDNHMIEKKRYLFPSDDYTIELDVFQGPLKGLILAEVEFSSMEEAQAFTGPKWFGKDVTMDSRFQNNSLSMLSDLSSLEDELHI